MSTATIDGGGGAATQGSAPAADAGRPGAPAAEPSPSAPADPLRLAVDTIPGLVWTALPDGHIDFLNRRWLDYTGLALEQAAGWGWETTVHPEDLPGLGTYWRSMLAAGAPAEIEARLRRHDGVYRWFLFRGVPLYDEQQELVRWYGQITDIEDRKRAETLLAGEKRLLEMVAKGRALTEVLDVLCRLVEATAAGCSCAIVLLEPRGDRLRCAAAPSVPADFAAFATGRPASACEGPCAAAAHSNEQVIAADIAADPRWEASGWSALALAHGYRACWSTPIRATDGAVLGTFALYYRSPGRPTGGDESLIEQFTDLASIAIERSQKEEQLRRNEAYLAEAQRLSVTGSFSWRPADGEVVWSSQTYRIYDVDPGVKPTLELARARVHPEDRAVFDHTAATAAASRGGLDFEHRLQLPNGTIKYLNIVGRAVHGADGQIVEFVGAVRDVTEQRLAEDALHEARAELAHVARANTVGALTASIAHEVNQPLSGIVTNANTCLRLLAEDPPNVAHARETAQRTIRDANRAAEVIARLRALFRKRRIVTEPLDLNEVVNEVIALTRSEVRRGGVVLREELATALPHVFGDRVQLQQVLLNLILNALEATSTITDRPRELCIRTHARNEHVEIGVQDNGVGLHGRDPEKIFEPFVTSKEGGMGMGLSISRSIVERHGGRIWAASRSEHGAELVFVLPSTTAPAALDRAT